jgi:hypothetical protein
MDSRIVEFISALRAAGVRVSIAESIDALRAIEQTGVVDKELFRSALQATLVKEQHGIPEFQRLFPHYFGGSPPPLQSPGGGAMSEEEQQQLQEMLQEMLEGMSPEQLAQLFQSMMSGQQMSNEQMQQMLNQLPVPPMLNPSSLQPTSDTSRATQRAMYQMRFDRLEEMLQELLEALQAAGMSQEALQELEETARQNMQALAEQIEHQVGQQMMEQMQAQGAGQGARQRSTSTLMDRPFEYLSERELSDLRSTVSRLAAQLRTRAALRQRRGKTGTLDAKRTIRSNMRFGGVPMVMHQRQRHMKPKLTVLCDLSISMRPVASFMLLLIYALQDQVSRTRSFAFIHDLTDISTYFSEARAEQAIETIMQCVRPPYSYATDLGNSLDTLCSNYLDCIDRRTTVIILGDGRNNHNNPNLRMFEDIKRRARRVIWFNPEPPAMWGQYDPGSLNSDMLDYAEYCDAVHHVSNMRQLVDAIDSLFAR